MPDLQANTLDLEVRVGNLEENSGDDGNSSIAELELRVDTLEDVTAELEIQMGSLENNTAELEVRVGTVEDVTADQGTRIVVAEENIQGETHKLLKLSRDKNMLYFTNYSATVSKQKLFDFNIPGLQQTDINHDSRISVLEDGGGSNDNS